MNLFKIAQEELDLLNEIEELEGELTPELGLNPCFCGSRFVRAKFLWCYFSID